MNFQPFFDATNIQPEQGGTKHPVGNKFPASISHTCIKETKDKDGGMFNVAFTTPQGSIERNYNLWNKSEQAVDIANKQLAALLWAIGIFKIHMTKPDGSPDWENAGAEIRNQRVQIDVNFQRGQEPTPDKPAGGYVEVSKVYDANGNEPGKAPTGAPQPQSGANGGGWNAPQATQPAAQPAGAGGWSSQAPATQTAPAASVAPAAGTWQPGPSAPAGGNPPWMK